MMYHKIKIISLLFLLSPGMKAQIKLSGTVVDTHTKQPLEFANVALLRFDSTFVDGSACDGVGAFTFHNLPPGDYLLSSTFVGYHATYTQVVHLDANRNLGSIGLSSSGVALDEVTVTGTTVIQKADRKLLTPSADQLQASNSGLTLLRNMQLPRIVVHPIDRTITTLAGEPAQLRINGVEVTAAEVMAIQPQDVIRIEYHDAPGMRYGGAAAVIDFITRRRESGGNLSANLLNTLWRLGYADDYLSARVNHNKSEFGLNVYYRNRRLNWTRENSQTLVFPTEVIRQEEVGQPTKLNENTLNVSLNYSLNEPDKYLFNATFRNGYEYFPNTFDDRNSILYSSDNPVPSTVSDHSTWRKNIPSLDLYYQRNLKNNQLVVFNAVGTYIDSRSTRLYRQTQEEAEPFVSQSCITGNKYSLFTEGVYEKKWGDSRLTGGAKHFQSYTQNTYTGNVVSHVGLIVAQTQAYAEYQIRQNRFTYTAGLGALRTYYSQDEMDMEKYIFRPILRVAYAINEHAYIRYNCHVSGNAPSLSYLNDVTQDIDRYQVQQGNPNLQTVWYAENSVNAGYSRGIFGAEFYAQYFYMDKPIMERITLEGDKFVHTNINQRSYKHVYSMLALRLKPWKEYITLSATPAFDHYICEGTDYRHTYTRWSVRSSLTAMYKHWFFYSEYCTRRNDLWGETLQMNDPSMLNLSAGYNKQVWSVSVVMANPFTSHWDKGGVNYSAVVPSSYKVYSHELGQVVMFNVSLNLHFGRQYSAARKRLENQDTDSGIMKAVKK